MPLLSHAMIVHESGQELSWQTQWARRHQVSCMVNICFQHAAMAHSSL